jgi:hypothetical protein
MMAWTTVFEGFVVVSCLIALVWLGADMERRGAFDKIRDGIKRLLGID